MIINVRYSAAVSFFAEGFTRRWNLQPYDANKPALFFGCYSYDDISAVLSHRHPKIVMLLGADMPNLYHLSHDKNVIFASDKRYNLNIFAAAGVRYIDKVIPLKFFSNFNLSPRGTKIYCYINQNTPAHIHKHGAGYLQQLIEHFGADNLILGTHGKTESQVIEHYYRPAFINLQLNPFAGFTSAIEMAHMGRRSVSNSPAPFSIPFSNIDDIIQIIKNEKLNLPDGQAGMINEPDLIGDYLHHSSDWLQYN